jgi:hypothetical protein
MDPKAALRKIRSSAPGSRRKLQNDMTQSPKKKLNPNSILLVLALFPLLWLGFSCTAQNNPANGDSAFNSTTIFGTGTSGGFADGPGIGPFSLPPTEDGPLDPGDFYTIVQNLQPGLLFEIPGGIPNYWHQVCSDTCDVFDFADYWNEFINHHEFHVRCAFFDCNPPNKSSGIFFIGTEYTPSPYGYLTCEYDTENEPGVCCTFYQYGQPNFGAESCPDRPSPF